MSNKIFVFGSNLAGRHGAGSAKHAKVHYGAKYGVGVGRTGMAYAIPTKDEHLRVLPLEFIRLAVNEFIEYAKLHPELEFEIVKVGCGLAGYKDYQIVPLFKDCPNNCRLPKDWVNSND
jgi:hypothetical protein